MNEDAPKPLSTEPYKGVRDFYPEDMFVQNYIFDTMRSVVEGFGYQEYGASILEPTELYRAKSSEEIVNEQTYSFKDRGDRDVTLRPEMTPTVARMVAHKRRLLVFPLRWYSIPNVFRYEQPQRGRLREHFQLNVDLFGADSIEADVEIIHIAHSLLKAFGATDTDFKIKINDRQSTLMGLREKNLTPQQEKLALQLLDKKSKLTQDEFKTEARKIFNDSSELEFKESDTVKTALADLRARGISNVIFDSSIVRGFDYYTGLVFEIFDTNPENRRSLMAGGRYDNLTANFGGEPVPAVGFGAGDVTMRNFLETRNLLPEWKPSTEICIATIGNTNVAANDLAQALRKNGLNVSVNVTDKKVGDQIKIADKQKIPFVLVLGEDEVKKKIFIIKELETGKETKCSSPEEIAKLIKK
jgi:histidyl-tRNA synthetase